MWVELLKRLDRGDRAVADLADRLQALVRTGAWVVPLASPHYMETWHRGAFASRRRLAGLMRDLSGYATLAAVHRVEAAEVEQAVAAVAGVPARCPTPSEWVLGHGVNHAFDSPIGRFRVVESIATDDLPEGPPADGSDLARIAALAPPEVWEWINLCGLEDELPPDELDRTPEHRRGTSDMHRELELRQLLETDSRIRARLDDVLIHEEFVRLLDSINRSCMGLRIDPHVLAAGPDTIRAFVESVPTARVLHALRLYRHRNRSLSMEQHDFTDMIALALAIPYCDVVATEKRWAHAARVHRLDRTFGTVMVASLAQLEPHLQ